MLGVVVAIVVASSAFVISYVLLNHFYGATQRITAPAVEPLAGETRQPPLIIYETKPIDVLPIATSISAAMGIVTLAVWIGYQRAWGEATSTLLEHGLHDMTVRDVEIVGYIMELGEFTIPELVRRTHASKITVWRTVQKMVEKGLVQPTEKTALTANGLGGRGKPSHVYKYVGKRGT